MNRIADHWRLKRRGLRSADLELPPSDDFAPVLKQLQAAMPFMQSLLANKPGKAPDNRLEGGWWGLSQRRYLRRVASAIAESEQLSSAIKAVGKTRYNDPDAEARAYDGLRDTLVKSRRVIRRGIDAAANYYHVLLDDSATANSIGTVNTKLATAIGKVTNTRFNYAALKDWLEDGTLPADQAPKAPVEDSETTMVSVRVTPAHLGQITAAPIAVPANAEQPVTQRRIG